MNSKHHNPSPKVIRHPSKHRSWPLAACVVMGLGSAALVCVEIAPHKGGSDGSPVSFINSRPSAARDRNMYCPVALRKLDELSREAARRQFDEWATANPRAAAAWAQKLDNSELCRSFLTITALRWAVTDVETAIDWARSLPEGELRNEIMAAIGSESIRSDPEQALRLVSEIPSCKERDDLVCRALAELAFTDRNRALEWALQIKDQPLLQRVTEQIAVSSADQDTAGAAKIVLEQMAPGSGQDRALVSIVQRMVQTDPAGASAWVSQFPNDSLGGDAIDNLVNLWAVQDPAAPGKWLLTLPQGALRNAGVLAYSRILRRTDAKLGERWARSVTITQ